MAEAIYLVQLKFSHPGDEDSARSLIEQAVPGAREIRIRQCGWDITDDDAAEIGRLSAGCS
jgi:hypothetical protein